MKCLKGLLLIGLTSTFFAAEGYFVGDDMSDVSDEPFQGAPVVKGRKTLVAANDGAFASSYANLTADVVSEEAINVANVKLRKIKSELDPEVWNSIEEAFATNNAKSIVVLLDKLAAKKVARLGIGTQRENSLKKGISLVSRNLSKSSLSPSNKTSSRDSLNVDYEHAGDSPDGCSNKEYIDD